MNLLSNLFLLPAIIIVFNELIFVGVKGSVRLTAITDMPHEYIHELYRKLRTRAPPSEVDPATRSARARQRICDDLSGSGVFAGSAITMEKLYEELAGKVRYSDLFRQIYGLEKDRLELLFRPYEYTNAYAGRTFELARMEAGRLEFYWTSEHVFVCPVKKKPSSEDIIPYYISKQYNVSGSSKLYTAGRFIFGINYRDLHEREFIKLAEEPATIYVKANFDIELYYLEMRGLPKRKPASRDEEDPMCKLVSGERRMNHYHRICAKVLNSSFYDGQIKHQIRDWRSACTTKNVSFRTEEAIILAAGVSYYERMIPCSYANHQGRLRTVYVSRAYRSRELFVYSRETFDDKLYVRNLVIDVGFVREPIILNFEDVED